MITSVHRQVPVPDLLLVAGGASAQDHVLVDDMGRLPGYTVVCDCMLLEDGHAMALCDANAASDDMQPVHDEDYRNQTTFCPIICNLKFTAHLTYVATLTDLESESAAIGEALRECIATEHPYPDVGCEGRRCSRINGD